MRQTTSAFVGTTRFVPVPERMMVSSVDCSADSEMNLQQTEKKEKEKNMTNKSKKMRIQEMRKQHKRRDAKKGNTREEKRREEKAKEGMKRKEENKC